MHRTGLLRSTHLLALLLLLSSTAMAFPGLQGEAHDWVEGADYDPALPTPSSVMGHPLGESPASVPALVAYARVLARSSARVELQDLGTSTEGDPLLLLVITAEDEMEGLAEREERMALLADPRSEDDERARARKSSRSAVWIACSVHGDEASGVDAGLWLAYHLAADRSAETAELLRRTVVLIDPCQNPDGRRRFLQHLRSFTRQSGGADPAPRAIEHTQLWPGGRFNHYFFDLNRDWAFLTQRETRARVAGFLRWRPQVFADLHEMGYRSSYFFPPVAEPVNPILPDELVIWLESFGRANAKAFDAEGLDYYVGEDFDLFYPGYGDSWPSLHGAIGMTYEQGSSRGLVITDASGGTRRYLDAVRGHFTAALATCRHAAEHSEELLDYFEAFHRQSLNEGARDPLAEYVLSAHESPAEARRLARILSSQGVEIWQTTKETELRLRDLRTDEDESLTLPAGSYRIPLEQPAYPVLRNLLAHELEIDEAFLEEEAERHELGLGNRFYDITAWSLPLSHGLRLLGSRSKISVKSTRFDAAAHPSHPDQGQVDAGYGYVLPYRDGATLRALAMLWKHGVKVHLTREPMRRGEIGVPAGSLVLKRATQSAETDLDALVSQARTASEAQVLAAASSWSDEGPSLGSNRVIPLRRPRILVATGPGVSPSSVGSLQWTLEQEFGVEYSSVLLSSLSSMRLRDVDVVVLPGLQETGPELPIEVLRPWVASGGTLVGIGGALPELLAVEEWLSARVIEDLTELEEPGGEKAAEEEGAPGDPSRARSTPEERRKPAWTPGAILDLELLPRHFLGFGAPENGISALILGDRLLEPGERSLVAAAYAEESPRRAGFMWPHMQEALPGMAYAITEKDGLGKVVLIAEEPAFRGSWPVTTRILLNAMLLGPSLAR